MIFDPAVLAEEMSGTKANTFPAFNDPKVDACESKDSNEMSGGVESMELTIRAMKNSNEEIFPCEYSNAPYLGSSNDEGFRSEYSNAKIPEN